MILVTAVLLISISKVLIVADTQEKVNINWTISLETL